MSASEGSAPPHECSLIRRGWTCWIDHPSDPATDGGRLASCDWGICNEPLREKEPTLCIAGHVQKGARMSVIGTAQAVIQRVDHGEGEPLNLWQATEAVQHPLAGLKREDLAVVVAYLACQVVGYAHRADADAGLALAQIRTAVQNYDRRHGAA